MDVGGAPVQSLDDPRQRQPDITRARETLGWAPKVPLREGLKATIAYFAGQMERPPKAARRRAAAS